jgi:hypothetical protein
MGQFMTDAQRELLSGDTCAIEEVAGVWPDVATTVIYDIQYQGDGYPDEQCVGMRIAHDLQEVHDSPLNWDENGFTGWEGLQSIAEEYGLNFTRPDTTVPVVEQAFA